MMMNEIVFAFIFFLHDIQPAFYDIHNLTAFYV